MRAYVHDKNKLPELFASIVNRLSGGGAHTEMINGLLKDVCEHFHFGCGLIYEVDHTETFYLKEFCSAYESQLNIPDSLRLEDYLSTGDFEKLKKDHIFLVQPLVDNNRANSGLTELFHANSLLITPVLSEEGSMSGLVAMLDRRHEILVDSDSVEAAKTVLKLLANHVLTHITQGRLTLARKSLSSILDNMGIDVYVCDFHTQELLFANKSLAESQGGWDNMQGYKCWEAIYGSAGGPCPACPRTHLLDDQGQPTKVYSRDVQRPSDGSWFRVFNAAFQWMDGRLAHVVSSLDITENKRNEETIHRLAYYDELTRLPNRRKLLLDCEESLGRLAADDGQAWFLFFDLDNFKTVNDTMGHQAGDELLMKLGRAMEDSPETRNRCYRLGGDEFILVYENVSRECIVKMTAWLLERFDQPWELAAGRAICRTSIGVARYPDDGTDAETLLVQADIAMYRAKDAGKGRAFFTDGQEMSSPANQSALEAGKNTKPQDGSG